MSVRWSARALWHLTSLRRYIATENPPAAARVAARILGAVAFLAEHPNLGRPGRVPSTRELVVSGTPYVVVYTISDEAIVQVLAVMHAAQKWPAKF